MAAGSSVLGRLSLDERRPALATARRLALVPSAMAGVPRRVVASPWAGGYAGWPAVASKVFCAGVCVTFAGSPRRRRSEKGGSSLLQRAGWLGRDCLPGPGLDCHRAFPQAQAPTATLASPAAERTTS